MSDLDRVLRAVEGPLLLKEIRRLREKYRETRLSKHKRRRNLLRRIHLLRRQYNDLMRHTLEQRSNRGGSLYRPQRAFNRHGLRITVELSLDGVYYSNPAPTVPGDSIVFVRATIEDQNAGELGIPKSHEMYRLIWGGPALKNGRYTKLDTIKGSGHDVYAVSQPLVITRRFRAPGSNTRRNFLVDVFPYTRDDRDRDNL